MTQRIRSRYTICVCAWFVLASVYVNPVSSSNHSVDVRKVRAAGCIILTPAGVVLGINRLLGTLQLPVGRRRTGEAPQQTAARETFEETGLKVSVTNAVVTLDEGAVALFHCTPDAPITDYERLEPVDRVEVSSVVVLDPHTMTTANGQVLAKEWRFPETRWLLRGLFPRSDP